MSMTRFPHGVSSMGVPVHGANDPTVGNIYYVIQDTTTAFYPRWYDAHHTTYEDGSENIHSTITTALAATVSERNDYVLVMPDTSDYSAAATLTMAAVSSHLICPAGLGPDIGCIRAATLGASAAAHLITVSVRGCEIAGFWLRHYADKYGIYAGTASTAGPYIHNNDFAMEGSGTLGAGVKLIGNVAGSRIENNYFFDNVTGGTIVAAISCDSGASRTLIRNNAIILSGGTVTVTKAIHVKTNEAWCWIDGNIICEAPGATVSIGIESSVNTVVTRNLIAITTTGNAVNGGTGNESYVENYTGHAGGTIGT